MRLGGGAEPGEVRSAYDGALALYLRLSPEVGRSADWLPSGAFCAYLAGRFEMAADLFAASMDVGHRDAFHAEYLLRAQLAAGQHDPLLRSARRLTAGFAAEVDRVLIEEGGLRRAKAWVVADSWLRRGDTEAGLWVFGQLVRASGDHPDALANLALALRHVGREDAAEEAYRRALARAPRDALLWNDLGLLWKGAGRDDEARTALVRSRELEPQPPTGAATTNLAGLGLRSGRHSLPDPAEALATLLAQRPEAELARRAYLDVLIRQAPRFQGSAPDKGERDG